jgi:hypothetical protein
MLKKLRGLALGDRIFWSIVIFVGCMFLWLKFIDSFLDVKVYPIAGILIVLLWRHLTREKDGYKKITFE